MSSMSMVLAPVEIGENLVRVLNDKRVALFIPAYDAERHIRKTLKRIPSEIANRFAQLYVIDDCSGDDTFHAAVEAGKDLGLGNLRVMRTPQNLGYGGNQKIGLTFAIDKGYDYVIMLHGDGQYAPEFLPNFVECLDDPEIAAIFGSRMLHRHFALQGGMPFYKWAGNQILTWIENKILGSTLSEFHTGYRCYSTAALRQIPFLMNADNFHFDTDIIVQLLACGFKIKEIPIPTHYGDEVCHVNGWKYALNCLRSVTRFRLHRLGLLYQARFDVLAPYERVYTFKKKTNTLHQYIINLPWQKTDVVVDLGAGDGAVASSIVGKIKNAVAIDKRKPQGTDNVQALAFDINGDFDKVVGNKCVDVVLALDVIEHLNDPEASVQTINRVLKNGGKLYASTANIAYIMMRISHLVGWFNYGKRGILDMTHHRLFTVNSFLGLLKSNGFRIERIVGFGPPIADQISDKGLWGVLDDISGLLARLWPSLFSFNFLVIVEKNVEFEELYESTTREP